ncbi:MAG: LacI family DNA-binding transcriptional regulator [Pseudomonadota bacterium]
MTARVTMRDVARALGVSPMTVSRALRADRTVSEETRARVRRKADELGYVYDTTAQAFRTQRSGFVAVTLPSINNANFAETFASLSRAMEGQGRQVLLGSTNYSAAREEDLVRQLLARNPEALVLTGGHHTAEARALLRGRGLPVVEMWTLPERPLGHAVGFSNAEAMGRVVRHVVQTGRRRLAYLGTSGDTDVRGAERKAGVLRAAAELDLPHVVQLDAGPAPVSMAQGDAAVAGLGRAVAQFDALLCVSDPVAFGALSACQRLGLSVPDDLAITGFGAFDVAAVSCPRLTTVTVHAHKIGQQVAEILHDILDGHGGHGLRQVDVGTALVVGETT